MQSAATIPKVKMTLTLNSVKASMVFEPFFLGDGMISCKLNKPSSSILTDVFEEWGKARVTRAICEVRYLLEGMAKRMSVRLQGIPDSEKNRNKWRNVSVMSLPYHCRVGQTGTGSKRVKNLSKLKVRT